MPRRRSKRAFIATAAAIGLALPAAAPAAGQPPDWVPGPPPWVGELVAEVFAGEYPWGTDTFPPGDDAAVNGDEVDASVPEGLPIPDGVPVGVPDWVPGPPDWIPGPPDWVDPPVPDDGGGDGSEDVPDGGLPDWVTPGGAPGSVPVPGSGG